MIRGEEDSIVQATQMVAIGAKGDLPTTIHALTTLMEKDLWMRSRQGSPCHSRDSIGLAECALALG